jgi:hypothetical protein
MRNEVALEYFIIQSEYVFKSVVEIEEIYDDSRSDCGESNEFVQSEGQIAPLSAV